MGDGGCDRYLGKYNTWIKTAKDRNLKPYLVMLHNPIMELDCHKIVSLVPNALGIELHIEQEVFSVATDVRG